MHTTHRILVLLAAIDFLLMLYMLYSLSQIRKDSKYLKKVYQDLHSRLPIRLLEHKPSRESRSEKASKSMKSRWDRLKEFEAKAKESGRL